MIVKTEKGEYVNLAGAALLRTRRMPSSNAKHDCCYVLEACYPTANGFCVVELVYNYDATAANILKDWVGKAWSEGIVDLLDVTQNPDWVISS